MIVQVVGRSGRARTLREYQAGQYPVPSWGYSPVPPDQAMPAPAKGCCCGIKARVRRRGLAGLGDGADLLSALGPSVATSTGSIPIVDYNPSIWVDAGGGAIAPPTNVYPVSPGGGQLTSQQLATLAIGSNEGSLPLPSVSPSTLLAAAALPNAPAVVKQAAAAYSASSPVSSFLSGSIAGIPTYMLLGAGALALLAFGSRGRR